ncbi:MAG: AAA family ATPase [Pseudomonadota bacterium]|nr:AAA family ATPase [Pseudomonadota bacterium]
MTLSDILQHPAFQTALLGAFGVLAYWAREVPVLVLGWLRQFFVSSMTVDSRDHFLFAAVVEHLQRYSSLGRSNQFTVHSRRQGGEERALDDDLRMGFVPRLFISPAQGLHIFRADGRLMWLRREVTAAQTVFERLTLSHFGRQPDHLAGFVREAVAARAERDHQALSIYVPHPYDGGEWMRARFGTRRPLSSVVLRAGLAEALLQDLRRFQAGRDRYVQLGIPWRRGYLLHGPPGTGKTSLVTALASELGLNICTFSLASPLVTDEKVHALLAGVPPGSLLLIEDVDAFFHQREAAHDEVRLSFSGFLNALDGVATQEGTVLVMTTNHPERLDPALIRAGRIDQQVRLDLADADQLRRLFLKFHDDPAAADAFVREHEGQRLSPARAQELLLRRYVNPSDVDVAGWGGAEALGAVTGQGAAGAPARSRRRRGRRPARRGQEA